jgi:hypothetical protein
LNTLYKIQQKFVEKALIKNHHQSLKNNLNNSENDNQFKYIDKLINQTPIGLFKKSELGEPIRLYYYISPLDLIEHNKTKNHFNSTYKIFSSITIDQLMKYELGAYSTISLSSQIKNENEQANLTFKLPDCCLLALNENDDERVWMEYLNPLPNNERKPLFKKLNNIKQLNKQMSTGSSSSSNDTSIQIPGTFLLTLNKPVVMCLATLNQLQSQIGMFL